MYTVGEKVVHPMHGAGVIAEITEERLSGALARYYVFTAPLSGLTLKIPVDNSGAVGLRQPPAALRDAVLPARDGGGHDRELEPPLSGEYGADQKRRSA